jgi:hypothetical protein
MGINKTWRSSDFGLQIGEALYKCETYLDAAALTLIRSLMAYRSPAPAEVSTEAHQ